MLLKILEKKKEISIEQRSNLSPSGSRSGFMYDSVKFHKIFADGFPSLGPILSTIGTTSYELSKFLLPMLET